MIKRFLIKDDWKKNYSLNLRI